MSNTNNNNTDPQLTLTDLQNKILEHEKTITELNATITGYKNIETTYKTDIEKLKEDNNKLKEHNMSLFLKVTTPTNENQSNTIPQNTPQPQPTKEKSIDDILNMMTTKEN